MKNIVILYHKDCPDGFGAAWAAWKKFGRKADYIPVEHQKNPPKGLKNKEIYSLDFCYTLPVLKKLVKQNKKVVVIDHHITSQGADKIAAGSVLSLDFTHSGAVLAWRYFHSGKPVPKLLQYIEDGDLWRFKLPFSRAINAYLEFQEHDFSLWNKMAQDMEDITGRKQYVKSGEVILKYKQKLIDYMVDNAQKVIFEGYKTLAVNSRLLKSRVGHALVEKQPPISIVWGYEEDVIVVSLRSNGTIDVAEMAGHYGGGGHKTAAGFTLKALDKLPWKSLTLPNQKGER